MLNRGPAHSSTTLEFKVCRVPRALTDKRGRRRQVPRRAEGLSSAARATVGARDGLFAAPSISFTTEASLPTRREDSGTPETRFAKGFNAAGVALIRPTGGEKGSRRPRRKCFIPGIKKIFLANPQQPRQRNDRQVSAPNSLPQTTRNKVYRRTGMRYQYWQTETG